MPPRLLVASAALAGLRAPEVVAALGRGVERAGLEPPDLMPLAGGGVGTREVLLLALGGEVEGEVALLEGGGTALVEAVPGDAAATGARVCAAVDAGSAVVLLAADVPSVGDPAAVVAAIRARGGLGAARLVVLCAGRRNLVPFEHTGGGLAGALHDAFGARLEHGPSFVLEALDARARMRASRAVILGADRLSSATLAGDVVGDLAVDARQDGVPSHAVCAQNALLPFDQRILDLQRVVATRSPADLEAAGEHLALDL